MIRKRATAPFLIILAEEVLPKYFSTDPKTFKILLDRTIHDPYEHQHPFEDNPRQIALEALLKHYPQHPQTLPLLRDKAENDPDEQLRKWAQRQLEGMKENTI